MSPTTGVGHVAALPMYDFPELRAAHDLFWAAIARRLSTQGIAGVPSRLSRDLGHREGWVHTGLLLGQACDYPLLKSFSAQLSVIARPRYTAEGCHNASYRSALLVRADDRADSLEALRNRRCIANESDSNSGMNLFRAAVAPVAGGTPYFASVCYSGSHRRSLELVAANEADVTAIDCVTLAHLRRIHPRLVGQLRIIGWTPSSPSLPYVTSRLTAPQTVGALRNAIADVFADPALASVRGTLLLGGVDVQPDAAFSRVAMLELEAQQKGYPALL